MKLYGHPDSGHAFKVKFFLDWVGVNHESHLQNSPDERFYSPIPCKKWWRAAISGMIITVK